MNSPCNGEGGSVSVPDGTPFKAPRKALPSQKEKVRAVSFRDGNLENRMK